MHVHLVVRLQSQHLLCAAWCLTPTGEGQVRTHIPVVFFTAKGVPGEVDEGMDSVKGAIAACARAMRNAAAAAGAAARHSCLLRACNHRRATWPLSQWPGGSCH